MLLLACKAENIRALSVSAMERVPSSGTDDQELPPSPPATLEVVEVLDEILDFIMSEEVMSLVTTVGVEPAEISAYTKMKKYHSQLLDAEERLHNPPSGGIPEVASSMYVNRLFQTFRDFLAEFLIQKYMFGPTGYLSGVGGEGPGGLIMECIDTMEQTVKYNT